MKNKHCNHYIIYSDDENLTQDEWMKADEFINGIEVFFDLNEAISRAIVCSKSTGVPFVVQPRNHASIDSKGMTDCCIVTPNINSVRQCFAT